MSDRPRASIGRCCTVIQVVSSTRCHQTATHHIYALGKAVRLEQQSLAMGVRCLDHSATTADIVKLQVTPALLKHWKQKESAYDCCCIRRQTRRRINQWIINNIITHYYIFLRMPKHNEHQQNNRNTAITHATLCTGMAQRYQKMNSSVIIIIFSREILSQYQE